MWQRRKVEWPLVHDFSLMQLGQEAAWISRTVVQCPNCGRLGLQFPDGVVHKASIDRKVIVDVCTNTAPDESPGAVMVSFDGEVIRADEAAKPRKDLN